MTNQVQVTKVAEDPSGLTLAELKQFVQDAENAGVDQESQVLVRVGFSAQIKRITAGGKL